MAFRRSVVVGFVACLLLLMLFAAILPGTLNRESAGPTREAFATNEYVLPNVRFTPSIQIGDTIWRKHEGLRVTGATGAPLLRNGLMIRHDTNGLGYVACESVLIPFNDIKQAFTFYAVVRRSNRKTELFDKLGNTHKAPHIWLHGQDCYMLPFTYANDGTNNDNTMRHRSGPYDLDLYDIVIITYQRTDQTTEPLPLGSAHLEYTMRGHYWNDNHARNSQATDMGSAAERVRIHPDIDIDQQFDDGQFYIAYGQPLYLYECGVLSRYIDDNEFDNLRDTLHARYFSASPGATTVVAFPVEHRLTIYNRTLGSLLLIGDDKRIHSVSPSGDSYETDFKYYGTSSLAFDSTYGEKLRSLLDQEPKFLKVDNRGGEVFYGGWLTDAFASANTDVVYEKVADETAPASLASTPTLKEVVVIPSEDFEYEDTGKVAAFHPASHIGEPYLRGSVCYHGSGSKFCYPLRGFEHDSAREKDIPMEFVDDPLYANASVADVLRTQYTMDPLYDSWTTISHDTRESVISHSIRFDGTNYMTLHRDGLPAEDAPSAEEATYVYLPECMNASDCEADGNKLQYDVAEKKAMCVPEGSYYSPETEESKPCPPYGYDVDDTDLLYENYTESVFQPRRKTGFWTDPSFPQEQMEPFERYRNTGVNHASGDRSRTFFMRLELKGNDMPYDNILFSIGKDLVIYLKNSFVSCSVNDGAVIIEPGVIDRVPDSWPDPGTGWIHASSIAATTREFVYSTTFTSRTNPPNYYSRPLNDFLPYMQSYMRLNQAFTPRPDNYALHIWMGNIIQTRFRYIFSDSPHTWISTATLDPTGAGYYLIDTSEPYDPGSVHLSNGTTRKKVASPSMTQMFHNALVGSDGDDLVWNIACVYDASDQILTVYLNERVHWWHKLPNGLNLTHSQSITIGSDSSKYSLGGRVHCTRVYDRALTHGEVVRLGNYAEHVQHSKEGPMMKLHIPYPIRISPVLTNHAEHHVVVNTNAGVSRTFSFWAHIPGNTKAYTVLFHMGDTYKNYAQFEAGVVVSYIDPWRLCLHVGEKKDEMYRRLVPNNEEFFGMTSVILNDGRPHHIVIRIDMYLEQVTLFVDGILWYFGNSTILTSSISHLPTTTTKLVLGKQMFDTRTKETFYNSVPDTVFEDVRYYETVLSQRTIRAIYERGAMHLKGRDTSDLVYGSRAGHFTDGADLCGYHCKTTCEFHRDPLALTCPPGEEAMCDLTPPPVIESAVRGPRLHPTMFGTFNLIDSGASSAPGLQFGFVTTTSGYPFWFANQTQQSSKMFRFPSPTEQKIPVDDLDDLKLDVLFSPQSSTVLSMGAYDYGMVAFKHAPMYHYLFRMNVSANVGSAALSFLTPEFLKRTAISASPDPDKADLVGLDLAWEALYTAKGFEDFDMGLLVVFEKRYHQLLGAVGEPMVLLADGTYA